MILKQEQSSAVISGNIKNNKVGINAENINLITSLLTSNLYSLPIESFFRETVSNAWDSHVEAGNTHIPVLIKIDYINSEDISVSIRDYGTGLSPERFDSIYRNIGSSTKRDTNDYIGCLGIGRFAALAVNNSVSIKSYYNNKCYNYLMYQDGETLNIDLLNTTDTDYDNGVEVQVTINDAYRVSSHIIEGIASLAYFEQIYVSSSVDFLEGFVKRFNDRKIHEFNTFKVCSLPDLKDTSILMGNVLYKHNAAIEEWHNMFYYTPNIAVKCDIGEIDITPNRENIRLSDKTQNVLESKYKVVIEEMNSIASNFFKKDFPTVKAYIDAIGNERNINVPLYEFEDYIVSAIIRMDYCADHEITNKCTIRSIPVKHCLHSYYNDIMYASLPSKILLYNYENGIFFNTSSYFNVKSLFGNYCIFTDDSYSAVTKRYVKEEYLQRYRSAKFLKRSGVRYTFFNILTNFYRLHGKTNPIDKTMLRLIIQDIKSQCATFKTFNNKDVPKEWLQSIRDKQKSERRECIIYGLKTGRGYYKNTSDDNIVTNTEWQLKDYVKSHTRVVYAEKGSEELRVAFRIFRYIGMLHKYTFIETAKMNIPTLRSVKTFIHVNDFMSSYNKYMAKTFTGVYISKIMEKNHRFLSESYVDEGYTKIIMLIQRCIRMGKPLTLIGLTDVGIRIIINLYAKYRRNGWLDKSIIDLVNNDDLYKLSNFLSKDYAGNRFFSNVAFNYFVYKHNIKVGKINRISAYKYLKTV